MVVHEHFPRDFRVRREARALNRAGYEVTIISLKYPGQPAHEIFEDLEVIRLPIQRHRGKSLPIYLAEYVGFCSMATSRIVFPDR